MASKKGGKCKQRYFKAKPVTNIGTCIFCQRAVDDEIIYGKLYSIGDIQCHYFCALLSCCLIQKGNDEEGLFGFLYPDILVEVERSKKHKCSYCCREGANLGCSVSKCRKQFHLPCGRERDAVSLFYGNYKSFCAKHAPKQKIVNSIMPNVTKRMAEHRRQKRSGCLEKLELKASQAADVEDTETVSEVLCVICYEEVEGYPTSRTFWPSCCARDAWFHRSCLQRMALSAGMHYLKCPLCNDKDEFYRAVISQGYYVPDRDAAWELEQNAFAEIYERPIFCSAEICNCPAGRDHDTDAGLWDIKLCILCGSTAIHAGCATDTEENVNIYICKICKPAAQGDLEELIASIEKVQLREQTRVTARRGPVMPSRMSLRRTKQRSHNSDGPSSSCNLSQNQCAASADNIKLKTEASRLELDLKKPVRKILEPAVINNDNILLSPIKMLEQGFSEKIGQLQNEAVVDPSTVLEKLREQLKKPRPLVVKKKIINNLLDDLFNNTLHDPKSKEALKEWNSPKKTCDVITEDSKEIIQHATLVENNDTEEKPLCDNVNTFNKNPEKTILPLHDDIAMGGEENSNDFASKSNFKDKHIEVTSEGSNLAINANKEAKRKLSDEDVVTKKRRKYNYSLKRKPRRNSSQNKSINQDKNGFEVDKSTTKAEFEIKKEIEDKEGSRTESFVKDDGDINNGIVNENMDAVDDKENVVNGDVDGRSENKPVEMATNSNVENDSDYAISKVNDESDRSQKLEEGLVKNRNESVEENYNQIDERCTVDSELKPFNNVLLRKKRRNYSLKRNAEKKSVVKSEHLDIVSEKCDRVKSEGNMELSNMNFKNDIIEALDLIIIDEDNEIDKGEGVDEIEKEVKVKKVRNRSRKIESVRNSKNKKNNSKTNKIRSNSKRVLRGLKSDSKVIGLTLKDNDKKLKFNYMNKHKKKLLVRNKDIKVKIRWKKEHFKLKITGKKDMRRLKEIQPKVFKQYVLKYSPEVTSPKEMIIKPDIDVTPVKRRYIKIEKHEDNMVQTNISSFFKATPKFN